MSTAEGFGEVASEGDAADVSAGVNGGTASGDIVDWPIKDIVMSRVRWTFGSHPNWKRSIVPGGRHRAIA